MDILLRDLRPCDCVKPRRRFQKPGGGPLPEMVWGWRGGLWPFETRVQEPLTFVKSGFGVSSAGVQSGWETEEEVWGGGDDARVKRLLRSPRIGAWGPLGIGPDEAIGLWARVGRNCRSSAHPPGGLSVAPGFGSLPTPHCSPRPEQVGGVGPGQPLRCLSVCPQVSGVH